MLALLEWTEIWNVNSTSIHFLNTGLARKNLAVKERQAQSDAVELRQNKGNLTATVDDF